MSDFNSTTDATYIMDTPLDSCGPQPISNLNLRIGAIFVILVGSLVGSLFPVLAKRVPALRRRVHPMVFEFAKFFGSGVILATAFIHLLEPAADAELGPANTFALGGCISNDWTSYPYAFGICLASLFFTFVTQLVAFRLGTARLNKLGLGSETDIQVKGSDGSVSPTTSDTKELNGKDIEKAAASIDGNSTLYGDSSESNPPGAQLLAVAILEFGIVFHSIIIGLTLSLASQDQFNVLFIVIVFHQTFEGLGLGSRLAFLQLPPSLNYIPILGSVAYSLVTPIGMSIGLGARATLATSSANASIAGGVLDAVSAGILIYTACVQLIGAEFIYNKYYHTCSWSRLIFAVSSFALGTGIMALLGKWA